MIDWQRIPPTPAEGAPFDGDQVLLFVDIATVSVVRLGWWRDGAEPFNQPEDRGWWSYVHSVSQDQLEGIYEPTHWAPYNDPADLTP